MKNNIPKAQLCYKNLCAKVQGEAAKNVNAIVIGGAALLVSILAYRALKK